MVDHISALSCRTNSADLQRREYPVTKDRAGIPEDFENYVNFLFRLRNRLNSSGRRYGVSITLAGFSPLEGTNVARPSLTFHPTQKPASYWYLKGFDIVKLEPHVDWYNIMTYDIRKLSEPFPEMRDFFQLIMFLYRRSMGLRHQIPRTLRLRPH